MNITASPMRFTTLAPDAATRSNAVDSNASIIATSASVSSRPDRLV